ncbi:MAG: citrate/2-methylcitrate synthase, partial [Bacillota bacterium]
MQSKIKDLLSEVKNPKIKEQYAHLIYTLLEKGYFPGLAEVPVVRSSISHIDGEKGVLTYRGYPVQELAEYCRYEDVCYLLLNGDLPLHNERVDLQKQLLENKALDYSISKVIVEMDRHLHPMYMLSASVLLLQGNDPDCFEVNNYNANFQRSISLIAKLPSIIGVFRNKYPHFAREEEMDSYAQYCLYAFNPELAQKKECVDIFEKLLILHADHTLNN